MSASEEYELVGLADAIEAVRKEIINAQQVSRGDSLTFRVGPVEMEFEVALTRRADYSGALRVVVLTGEEGGKRSSIVPANEPTTHRVRLTMEPVAFSDNRVSTDDS